MSRLKVVALLYVEWEDHTGEDGWTSPDRIDNKPSLCRSVGWLFKEDRKALTIIGSHAEYEGSASPLAMGTLTILKGCIRRRVKLKDPSQ